MSDKLGAIKRAFNRHLYRIARLVHGVPIACKRFGLRFNNNAVERSNQDVKQRYKVMRGFKSFRSARAFMRLHTLVYNFVRHGTRRVLRTEPRSGRGSAGIGSQTSSHVRVPMIETAMGISDDSTASPGYLAFGKRGLFFMGILTNRSCCSTLTFSGFLRNTFTSAIFFKSREFRGKPLLVNIFILPHHHAFLLKQTITQSFSIILLALVPSF